MNSREELKEYAAKVHREVQALDDAKELPHAYVIGQDAEYVIGGRIRTAENIFHNQLRDQQRQRAKQWDSGGKV